jgi:hypothetical protein
MDINLTGVTRALSHLGLALDELRAAVQAEEAGIVRLHTEDRSIEMPVGLAVAGVLGLVALAVFRSRARGGVESTAATEYDDQFVEAPRARVAS